MFLFRSGMVMNHPSLALNPSLRNGMMLIHAHLITNK
jgi:hypothetical protein